MKIKHELIDYGSNTKVWAGKYRNSQNLLHWHYDCELIYAEKGNFRVTCEKKTYILKEGESFFIDSEMLHCISAERTDGILTTFFFTYDIISGFTSGRMLTSPLLTKDYGILNVYAKIKDEFAKNDLYRHFAVQLIIADLMLTIFRNEETVQKGKAKKATKAFKKLLEEIDENFEFMTFDAAADLMGMNPSYFSRFFNNLAGMPFSRYLNLIKVEKAIELLQSGKERQITEISLACGFPTIRSFNRVFKEITGYSPTNIPEHFILDDNLSKELSPKDNPTLSGCELIEKLTG